MPSAGHALRFRKRRELWTGDPSDAWHRAVSVRSPLLDRATRQSVNPPPHGSPKQAGHDNLYRLRVGDWRISYAVDDERLVVLITEIASRGAAYRDL